MPMPGTCCGDGVHLQPRSASGRADETALGVDVGVAAVGTVSCGVFEGKNDFLAVRRQLFRRDRQLHRHADDFAGGHLYCLAALQLQPGQPRGVQRIGMVKLILVDDLHAVHVFDPAVGAFPVQHAVLADIQPHQRARHERAGQQADHDEQHRAIADQPRPQPAGHLPGEGVLGGVADQPAGVVHFVHNRVAGVNARRAADAGDLQAVADVDAGGADLHAHRAIDAVAEAPGRVVQVLFSRTAWLAASWVIRDDEGVLVEHHALKPRVRAHVDAHLFAQPTGIGIRGKGEKAHPEIRPAVGLTDEEVAQQFTDRREVTDEGQPGRRPDQDPEAVLGGLAHEGIAGHGQLVAFDALVPVALGKLFAPHEDPGPYALRAGVAAPDASGPDRDEEQAESADDQDAGQQDEILRPERCAKDVELALRQVPPHRLMIAPLNPDRTEVQQEQQRAARHAHVAEQPDQSGHSWKRPMTVEHGDKAQRWSGGRMGGSLQLADHCAPPGRASGPGDRTGWSAATAQSWPPCGAVGKPDFLVVVGVVIARQQARPVAQAGVQRKITQRENQGAHEQQKPPPGQRVVVLLDAVEGMADGFIRGVDALAFAGGKQQPGHRENRTQRQYRDVHAPEGAHSFDLLACPGLESFRCPWQSPFALDEGAQALQVGHQRIHFGLAFHRLCGAGDVGIGVGHAEAAQHLHLLRGLLAVERRFGEEGISRHDRLRHQVARVVQMRAVPVIRITTAHPRKVRPGAFGTPQKRVIPDTFARHRIMPVPFGFGAQWPDHLGMAAHATIGHINVAAFELQRRAWCHAFNRLSGDVLKKQRDDLRQPANGNGKDHEDRQQTDVLLECFVFDHECAPTTAICAAACASSLSAARIRAVVIDCTPHQALSDAVDPHRRDVEHGAEGGQPEVALSDAVDPHRGDVEHGTEGGQPEVGIDQRHAVHLRTAVKPGDHVVNGADGDHCHPAQRAGVNMADGPVGVVGKGVDGFDGHHRPLERRHAVERQRQHEKAQDRRRVVQVMRPGPDVQGDQGPEVHDRQAIGVDRAFGLLRNEVIHHPEKPGGEEKSHGIVPVPPLDHGVRGTGVRRIRLEQAHRQRDVIDDVQHRGDHDEGAIKPVGDINVFGLAVDDGAEKHDAVGDPDDRQQDRDRPFEFGVFLGGGVAHRQGDDGADDHRLPAPEVKGGHAVGNQPRLAGSLDHVVGGAEQRAAAERENHQVGVQRAQSAEGGPRQTEVQIRPHQLRGDEHAQAHADDAPDHRHDGELADDFVVISSRVRCSAHFRSHGVY
nr:hypothetical protein [Tanacetum cinerariifolium]